MLIKDALRGHIPRIVFLGAGYDSQPYRFAGLIKGTRFFELDVPPAQERKRSLLDRAGIAVPEHLTDSRPTSPPTA